MLINVNDDNKFVTEIPCFLDTLNKSSNLRVLFLLQGWWFSVTDFLVYGKEKVLITFQRDKLTSVAEFKEFERWFKFKPRFKYGWLHLKLYQMFQDLSRCLI